MVVAMVTKVVAKRAFGIRAVANHDTYEGVLSKYLYLFASLFV